MRMDFIKKDYEKILLGVVLLGLAVAVALLPVKVSREQEDLLAKRKAVLDVSVSALTNLDETRFDTAYKSLDAPEPLNLSRPHNLFNPVPWQKKTDGALIPLRTGSEVGPEALSVVKIHPLYTTVAFDGVGASGSNYLISVIRDADPDRRKRGKKSSYLDVGVKGDFLTLEQVKGPPDKLELTVVLNDTGRKVSVMAQRPYQRADGYSADLKYDPEKISRLAQRVGDKLALAGDEFTIVAINLFATNQFEVVVSARSTGKKTTVHYGSDAQP